MAHDESGGDYQKNRLFIIGILALFTAAMSTALRGAISGDIKADYIDPIDLARSGEMIATALSMSFLGFAGVLFFVSPFLDTLGMGRILIVASLSFIIGNLMIIFPDVAGEGMNTYWMIYVGMLLNGMSWGGVEATINPMTTALYKDDKTHKLNVLHAWWPAGLVAGGLIALGGGMIGISWQIALSTVIVSAVIFGVMIIGVKFPPTERAEAGVSMGEMFMETFKRPTFFIWFFAMFLTAASELAPGQWIEIALSTKFEIRGFWIVVYVSMLMFVMRHFAGPLAHRLSDTGLLWFSCLLAAAGLYLLSVAEGPYAAFGAATVWGIGVCYMWPTMLAAVAERYPRGGSWKIGLLGSAGALSIYFVLPAIGRIYDKIKLREAGSPEALANMGADELTLIESIAGAESFRMVAILPAVLLIVFGLVWLFESRRKS